MNKLIISLVLSINSLHKILVYDSYTGRYKTVPSGTFLLQPDVKTYVDCVLLANELVMQWSSYLMQ